MTEEPPKQSAAATAAEKVRTIVEAAERSAAELEAAAREDAARIRAEARREVEPLVSRASEVGRRVAERAEHLQRQVEAIRASVDSLAKDLEQLRAEPAAPAASREGQPVANTAPADDQDDVDETIAEAEATAAREPELAGAESSGEGARVIALNMALSGTPRDETARYLAENFELDDPNALLDEVYARVGS